MNSIKEICEVLREKERILILPHVNMDGDALGSAVALTRALRIMNKEAYVLLEDEIPLNISFLKGDYTTYDENILDPDLVICIDCGAVDRFSMRKDVFLNAPLTMCIDHHPTSKGIADLNYIDGDSPATGQIVFLILKELGIIYDKEIGEAIFCAITTDTGNFQYSSTNKQSFEIAAQLMDWGIDLNKVSVEVYQNERLERIMIENKVLSTTVTVGKGKGAIAYVTQDMLKETGADMSETEDCVSILRNIRGVEFAAFIKENEDRTCKVSMRAKTYGNVAKIASKYNGGGHTKASGFSLDLDLSKAFEIVKEEILSAIEDD
ncbi:MAG: bifunctional oligoribonuclease/PAP phosphatase NrnA [Clostridia bacterium]|nr:bifunctional oligoribonuclease/PAP phosphatase NrnA [Clostridia bacterium]